MGKHHELSAEKALFLLELWHRERGLVIDKVEMLTPEEAARYIQEHRKFGEEISA